MTSSTIEPARSVTVPLVPAAWAIAWSRLRANVARVVKGRLAVVADWRCDFGRQPKRASTRHDPRAVGADSPGQSFANCGENFGVARDRRAVHAEVAARGAQVPVLEA